MQPVIEEVVIQEEVSAEVEVIQEEVQQEVEETQKEEIYVLHWDHMPVTYFITNEDECGDYEARKIMKGFDMISEVEGISFKQIDSAADIDIKCSFIEDCYEYKVDVRREEGVIYKYETICNHKKGIASITRRKGFKILKAEIEMIGLAGFAETNYGSGASGFYIGSCGHPTTEVHEILHTFGFGHYTDPNSIMYYAEDGVSYTLQKQGACVGSDKQIDKEIVDELKEIYS